MTGFSVFFCLIKVTMAFEDALVVNVREGAAGLSWW